jgi:hypothetical protein
MSFNLDGLVERTAGLHDQMILVQLREQRRNLPLAKGVVECSSICCAVMPRRAAVTRSMTSGFASRAIQLLVGGQVAQDGNGASLSINLSVHSCSSCGSGSSSVYWYWVRLTRSSTVKSCTGCMKRAMSLT